MGHWMMDCREISRLVSESMDRKLPFYKRMGIQMHVMMCRFCYRYRKQLFLIRKVIRFHLKTPDDVVDQIHLSDSARKRMVARINQELAG